MNASDHSGPGDPEGFFEGSPNGYQIYSAVADFIRSLGPVHQQVSKSQIAFRRRRGFAYLWRPGRYVKSEVPAVLSIAVPSPLTSPRFKEVVSPSPNVWMHHLELGSPKEVDEQVHQWLAEAYRSAE